MKDQLSARGKPNVISLLRLRLGGGQRGSHGVEDAIHKFHGAFTGESPGYFEGLIHDDSGRRFRKVNQLIESQPQNVSIHGGHTLDPPILGVPGYQSVERRRFRDGSLKQRSRKFFNLRSEAAAPEESLQDMFRRMPALLPLKQHLQGEFTRFSSGRHQLYLTLRLSLNGFTWRPKGFRPLS